MLQHLKTIYAKNKDYSAKIILSQIEDILTSGNTEADVCEKIGSAIEGISLSEEGVSDLLEAFRNNGVQLTTKISTNIIRMCKETEKSEECIEFFNSNPSFGKGDTEFSHLLIGMYSDALDDGIFKDEWKDCAMEFAHVCLILNILTVRFIAHISFRKISEMLFMQNSVCLSLWKRAIRYQRNSVKR